MQPRGHPFHPGPVAPGRGLFGTLRFACGRCPLSARSPVLAGERMRNLMTEAISIIAPARRRAAGAITLARILWWLALLTVVAGGGPCRRDLRRLLDHVRRAGAYCGWHAAARQERIYATRRCIRRWRASRRRSAPISPAIARSTAAICGSRGGGCFTRSPAHPDVEMLTLARAGILPFMIFCLVLVWLWTSRYCRSGRGRSRRDRARQSADLSGAFRSRDDRRGVCRHLYRSVFRVRAVA